MTPQILSFLMKLRRLEAQINISKWADYSFKDSLTALRILASRTSTAITNVETSESLSPVVRNQILRDVNFHIMRSTYIIGVITRSNSIRNPFEMYTPFLRICKSLLDENANLILSSEWQYIPFTHPQNLSELPSFVVIGMPASESDNVLVFPVAGHELGHSVWQKLDVRKSISNACSNHNDIIFSERRDKIEVAFPDIKNADFDQDMFVQYIKSTVFNSALAQLEEYFSDFIGLILFGEGYLHAFEYLIGPQLGGIRSSEYPEIKDRTKILESYANKIGIAVSHYSDRFLPDQPPKSPQDLILQLADAVTNVMIKDVFEIASDHVMHQVATDKLVLPSLAATEAALGAFERGIPYEGKATIGDLINAAWKRFNLQALKPFVKYNGNRRIEDELADLVMKSVEMQELRDYKP